MMIPTSFEESNDVLDKPEDTTYDEYEALSVYRGPDKTGQQLVISCWKPTKEELDEINKTGRVWLIIWGNTMQPSCLSGITPFKENNETV
jgi:hypothetical protein